MSSSTPQPNIDALVLAEQARLILDRSRLSNFAKVGFALLVCWLMHDHTAPVVLLAWITALCLTTAWRGLIDVRFVAASSSETSRWLRHFQWAVAVDGLVFGMIGFFDYRNPASELSFIMVTSLIAAEAIGFVVFYMHVKTMLIHVLPALVPVVLWQALQGTEQGLFIGLGGMLFIGLITSEGLRADRHTSDMLRLRYQMDELAAQRAQALSLAEHHSALKSRVLATMSHEIRTPLHGVLGITRLLDTALSRGEVSSGQQHVQTLRRSGEHLLAVVNDVLDYSSIESQRVLLDVREFDLAQLTDDVVTLTRGMADHKGLDVSLDMDIVSPYKVLGDAARLRQILLNLTGNAVKFTDEGSVALKLERTNHGRTLISVIDTGAGIPSSDQETIFDAFRQADASFGRRHGGTGLGLTIARELARAMGGDLTCKSELDRGSTFVLSLPLPAAPDAPENPSQGMWSAQQHAVRTESEFERANGTPSWADRQPVILLVDDNRLNAYVAEGMLEDMGFRVVCADGGAEAIEFAAQQSFDLILMDCQMPLVDGFEATRRIRAQELAAGLRPVPIVAVTANALESDRQRSLAAGMDDHLAKPFGRNELAVVVHKALKVAA